VCFTSGDVSGLTFSQFFAPHGSWAVLVLMVYLVFAMTLYLLPPAVV
jgi:hypothetical protein